ncbi:caspase-8-like isoform X2 [Ascaphus truei]|uniref:caspase-8-like isoform X2 n=1 Tax=Ascaphus truei TaxID=8439 RepID=UPI003F5AB5E3
MAFCLKLYGIDEHLGNEEVEGLKFLCHDLLPGKKLMTVQSGLEFFQLLMSNGLIEDGNDFLLAELLYLTGQHKLLKMLDTDRNKVQEALPTKGTISPYRRLLYELSENLVKEDLESIIFLLSTNDVLRKKQKDNTSVLELLCYLEKMEVISQDNLSVLEDILGKVSPDLLRRISKYKEEMASLQSQDTDPSETTTLPTLCTEYEEYSPPEDTYRLPLPIKDDPDMNMEHPAYSITDRSLREHTQTVHEAPERDSKSGNIEHYISELSLNAESTSGGIPEEALYEMNRKHRGHCLIISNLNFMKNQPRKGTGKDADDLYDVFTWLGLEVEICKDQTAEEISKQMERYKSKDHNERDCFICCILTHGESGAIMGADDAVISIHDVMSYFTATNCPSLATKPKLFFIQACQGKETQKAACVEADANVPRPVERRRYVQTIPDQADFLLGMSTVDGYSSFRHVTKGTWYIQALCENLAKSVPRGEDILSILTKVNQDVSLKEDRDGKKKQMPMPAYTLRKKIIFPLPPSRFQY